MSTSTSDCAICRATMSAEWQNTEPFDKVLSERSVQYVCPAQYSNLTQPCSEHKVEMAAAILRHEGCQKCPYDHEGERIRG